LTPFKKIVVNLQPPNGNAGPEKIEFLGDGQQYIVAGIHPDSGKAYTWKHGKPGDVRRADLPEITAGVAQELVTEIVDLLIAKHGYTRWKAAKEKKQKEKSNDNPWADNTKIDLSDPVENIINGVELHDSIRDFAASMIGSGVSPNAAGGMLRAAMQASVCQHDQRWQDRYDDIDRAIESAVEKYQPKVEHASGELFDPWAPFTPPEFPLDILPAVVREFVGTQSEVIGCDMASMAMTTLGATSGAADHRHLLKIMRHGDWFARPRLWVLLCGVASLKKTPLIDAATQPLQQHQNDVQFAYKMQLQSLDKGDEKPPLPARNIVYDTTIEKLGEILARDDRGLLVKRDEFAGWLGSMEKYGGTGKGASANRAFWLQAHDGGNYVVDRISRGEIFIPNLSVSLIGGIQPARLVEMHGLTSDGLLQRFLPTMMGPSALAIDRPVNNDAYTSLIRRLLKTEPMTLTLSDPALEVMNDLRAHLFELEQAASGMATGFQSFVGKLPGMAGNLALLLHLISDPKNIVVQLPIAKNVQRLVVDFILPHAVEFYRAAEGAGGGDRLQKIASWILTNRAEKIVASDLTSNIWDCRGLTASELHDRMSPLVAAGWLTATDRAPISRAWSVNPKVFTQFAPQGARATTRKGQLRRLLGVSSFRS
jgi:hypothetical protein